MAAIAFNAAHRSEHLRERYKTALAAFRDMLDAFVSHRMRQSAAEAGHARPRRRPVTSSQSINTQ
jgi:hypothetical protein